MREQIPQPIQRSSEMNAILSFDPTSIQSLPILTTGHDLDLERNDDGFGNEGQRSASRLLVRSKGMDTSTYMIDDRDSEMSGEKGRRVRLTSYTPDDTFWACIDPVGRARSW